MKRKKNPTSSKGASLSSLTRPYASAAIAELARIMTGSRSDNARVAASNSLLDRAFGRPPQALSIATKDVVPMPRISSKMTEEESAEYYARMIREPRPTRD